MAPDGSRSVPERLRFDQVGSTNTVLLRLADQDVAEHTLVLAEEQTEPRGGSGPWHAPPGGLWFSTLWRPQLDACEAARLTLASAWGVREGLRRHTGLAPGLKWPNDLIVDDRKLGGVLVEGRVEGHDVVSAAIGVGVNVNNPSQLLPEGVAEEATSLQEELRSSVDLEELLDTITESLEEARELVDRPRELVARVDSCWTQKGADLEIDTGYTMLEGRADRIDPDGVLVLDRDGTEHRIEDPSLAKFVRVV